MSFVWSNGFSSYLGPGPVFGSGAALPACFYLRTTPSLCLDPPTLLSGDGAAKKLHSLCSTSHLAWPGRLPIGCTASGSSLQRNRTRFNRDWVIIKPHSCCKKNIKIHKFDPRDEDGVDEVVRSEIGGAALPESERRVEVSAVEDGLCRRLHLH